MIQRLVRPLHLQLHLLLVSQLRQPTLLAIQQRQHTLLVDQLQHLITHLDQQLQLMVLQEVLHIQPVLKLFNLQILELGLTIYNITGCQPLGHT